MAVNGLQTLVDDLADELRRSVVIDDPVVRLLCTSRHFGDEDELRVRAVLQRDAGPVISAYILDQGVAQWSRAGMVEGRADLGMRARLCVPLRERGELLGLLMVIDAERTLTAAEIARIEEVSRTASALLYQERAAADRERVRREQTLLALLGTDPGARGDAVLAGADDGWPAGGAEAVVTVVEVTDRTIPQAEVELALRSALESASRRQPRRLLAAVHGNRGTIVQAGEHLDRAEIRSRAERVVAGVERLLGRAGGVVAGVGDAVGGLDEAWRSNAQAQAAARGSALLPGAGPVADWTDLGAYAILLRLPPHALGPELVPAPVARLVAHEKADRLVETLRVFLDHAGSMPRTAEVLHLHRTSLYYRLDQVRAITGVDLDDGRGRLLLHLGLLIADLVALGE